MNDNTNGVLLRETYLIDSDTAGIQLQLLRSAGATSAAPVRVRR